MRREWSTIYEVAAASDLEVHYTDGFANPFAQIATFDALDEPGGNLQDMLPFRVLFLQLFRLYVARLIILRS